MPKEMTARTSLSGHPPLSVRPSPSKPGEILGVPMFNPSPLPEESNLSDGILLAVHTNDSKCNGVHGIRALESINPGNPS